LTMRREEGLMAGFGRGLLSLLITGIAVEVALAPIALFHFHKSGLYGALANIVAIPLTTFVVMPLEALALLFDSVGAGAPFWWLTGQSLELLLWLSRTVAALPGAVAALPSVPGGAFALIIVGGLWAIIWKSRVRAVGFVPVAIGMIWAVMTPAPDILVTGDGKHMALRGAGDDFALLRPRAGDYVRDTLGEGLGAIEMLSDLDVLPGADCGRDMCIVTVKRGARIWRIAATRSGYFLPWEPFIAACTSADIIISDRKLPATCTPRWLKADRDMLRTTGGLAIELTGGTVRTVKIVRDLHPWVLAQSATGARR
jgi:competence protein ComEC